MRRSGSVLAWTSGLSSAVFFVLAISLAIHVRVGLGHWPEPMRESYRTSAYEFHETALVWAAMFVLYAAIPLWVLCVSIRPLRSTARVHLIQAGIYVMGWGLVVGFLALDPFGFVSWFMD